MLATHPAVAESAVIAVPDDIRGEVPGFVALGDPDRGTPGLGREIAQHVKTKYAALAYPRAVHFVAELPKTPSGKIQRYMLRQRRREEIDRERSADAAQTVAG